MATMDLIRDLAEYLARPVFNSKTDLLERLYLLENSKVDVDDDEITKCLETYSKKGLFCDSYTNSLVMVLFLHFPDQCKKNWHILLKIGQNFGDFDIQIVQLLVKKSLDPKSSCIWIFTKIIHSCCLTNPIFKHLVKEILTDDAMQLEVTKFISLNVDFTGIKFWIEIMNLLNIVDLQHYANFPFSLYSSRYIDQIQKSNARFKNLFKFKYKQIEKHSSLISDLVYLQLMEDVSIIWVVIDNMSTSIIINNGGLSNICSEMPNNVIELKINSRNLFKEWEIDHSRSKDTEGDINILLEFIDSQEKEYWSQICRNNAPQKQVSQSQSPTRLFIREELKEIHIQSSPTISSIPSDDYMPIHRKRKQPKVLLLTLTQVSILEFEVEHSKKQRLLHDEKYDSIHDGFHMVSNGIIRRLETIEAGLKEDEVKIRLELESKLQKLQQTYFTKVIELKDILKNQFHGS